MMMRVLLLVWVFALPAFAEEERPAPCSASEYDQFDFWLGKWTARNAEGEEQGTNHLRQMMGNCVMQENWTSAGGEYKGTSYNFYDARNETWHQTWVDNGGGHLFLSGGMVDGKMRLSGERKNREGQTVIDRITWTPLPDGRVRQHWQVSPDHGETWNDVFDGYYTKDTKDTKDPGSDMKAKE